MKTADLKQYFGNSFPALKYQNFRYFWFGQCISLIGTWMQVTALQWLVYTITKSALLLGILGVAQFGPIMIFSLFAGVFVDRYSRKKILILTQTAAMIQAFLLAIFVLIGHVVYWEILVLAVFTGFVNTLDSPARQSFMPEIVGKAALGSAIGLNMTIFNSARIIGPALAALLMARFDPGLLFLINGLSYIPVIILLYRVKVSTVEKEQSKLKVFSEIKEGLDHLRRSPIMMSAILAVLALGTFIMNYNVIIPLYAVDVLNQGVSGYGFLLSALGVGSLLGSLLVAFRKRSDGSDVKVERLFFSALIVSILFVIMNFVNNYAVALILLTIIGFVTLIFMSTANLTLQLKSSNTYRGRVMSVYSFAFLGTTPVGNLIAGAITEKFGAGLGFLICGVVTGGLILIVAAGYFYKKKS
jgi:MFS family permease